MCFSITIAPTRVGDLTFVTIYYYNLYREASKAELRADVLRQLKNLDGPLKRFLLEANTTYEGL